MLSRPRPCSQTAATEAQVVFSTLLVVVVVAMVWYATNREPQERIVYQPAPTPAATPTPKPTPMRHLAPEGTFYLLTYLSVPTAHGIIGFEPGREVTLVEVHEKTGALLVTDGKYTVEARPQQLTNDMDIAALARNQDERSQQTVTAYLNSEREAFQKIQQQIDAEHSAHVDKINEQMAKSSAIGHTDNPLNAESEPASSYDRYYLRNGGSYYGSPYYYLYRRQYPYYNSNYY